MTSGAKSNKKSSANRSEPNKTSAKTEQQAPRGPEQQTPLRPERQTIQNPEHRPATPSPKQKLAKWLDEWKMAAEGIVLAAHRRTFLISAILTFLIFGTLMNLLTNGFSSFKLMTALDFGGKVRILADAFLATFGIGRSFLDWLFVFVVAFLQAILIGLVVFVYKERKKLNSAHDSTATTPTHDSSATIRTHSSAAASSTHNSATTSSTAGSSDNAQNASLAAGLAILSSGCPTCGTTLLAPVIGAISSTGGYALAGALTGVIFAGAILVSLLSIKKTGTEAYAIIKSEDFIEKRRAKSPSTDS